MTAASRSIERTRLRNMGYVMSANSCYRLSGAPEAVRSSVVHVVKPLRKSRLRRCDFGVERKPIGSPTMPATTNSAGTPALSPLCEERPATFDDDPKVNTMAKNRPKARRQTRQMQTGGSVQQLPKRGESRAVLR